MSTGGANVVTSRSPYVLRIRTGCDRERPLTVCAAAPQSLPGRRTEGRLGAARDEAPVGAGGGVDVPAVGFELVLQAANADLQEPCGFGPVAVDLVESPEDVAALHFAQRQPGLEQSREHGRGSGDGARRVSGEEIAVGQRIALGEHDGLLEEVLELPHVAR